MQPAANAPAQDIARRKAQMAEQVYEMGLEIRRGAALAATRERAEAANGDGPRPEFFGPPLAWLTQPVLA